LTTGLGTESRAELTASGAFEHVEQEHIAQLPMAVRRALNDKKLREELEGPASLAAFTPKEMCSTLIRR
jgi:hypothetical protein